MWLWWDLKKSHESRWQTRFTCKLLNGLILYVKQNDNCRNLNNHGVDKMCRHQIELKSLLHQPNPKIFDLSNFFLYEGCKVTWSRSITSLSTATLPRVLWKKIVSRSFFSIALMGIRVSKSLLILTLFDVWRLCLELQYSCSISPVWSCRTSIWTK